MGRIRELMRLELRNSPATFLAYCSLLKNVAPVRGGIARATGCRGREEIFRGEPLHHQRRAAL